MGGDLRRRRSPASCSTATRSSSRSSQAAARAAPVQDAGHGLGPGLSGGSVATAAHGDRVQLLDLGHSVSVKRSGLHPPGLQAVRMPAGDVVGRAVAMKTWCSRGRHFLQPPGPFPVQFAEDVVEEEHRPDPALSIQDIAAGQDQGDGRRAGLALGSEGPQIEARRGRTSKSSSWGPIRGLPRWISDPQYSQFPSKISASKCVFFGRFFASGIRSSGRIPDGVGKRIPGVESSSVKCAVDGVREGVSAGRRRRRGRDTRRRRGRPVSGSRPPVPRGSLGRSTTPRLQVAQQARLLLQGALEGRQVGQVGRVDLGHALIHEVAPALGPAAHQAGCCRDRRRPWPGGPPGRRAGATARRPGGSGGRRAVQAELAGAARSPDPRSTSRSTCRASRVEGDQFLVAGAAVGAAQGEVVEGFQELVLPFAVAPQDQIDPGRKVEARCPGGCGSR